MRCFRLGTLPLAAPIIVVSRLIALFSLNGGQGAPEIVIKSCSLHLHDGEAAAAALDHSNIMMIIASPRPPVLRLWLSGTCRRGEGDRRGLPQGLQRDVRDHRVDRGARAGIRHQEAAAGETDDENRCRKYI